jgi:hypothetical protein
MYCIGVLLRASAVAVSVVALLLCGTVWCRGRAGPSREITIQCGARRPTSSSGGAPSVRPHDTAICETMTGRISTKPCVRYLH